MTFDEFHSIWMLQTLKKRRKMENFELQALRDIVKENTADVVERFEEKFKEIKVEGKRKSHGSSTMYADTLPKTHYTEAEQREMETMYMGTDLESRKRFQRNRLSSQQRGQSQDRRQRSLSQSRYNDYSRDRSRYDRFK